MTSSKSAWRAATAAAILMLPQTIAVGQDTPALAPSNPDRLIDISVQYNISVPVKSDDLDQQAEALESGRKMLYAIAANECTLMLSTIASSCRLERLNLQSQSHRQPQAQQVATLSATASYKVGIKSSR